jgi:hypothetical protein
MRRHPSRTGGRRNGDDGSLFHVKVRKDNRFHGKDKQKLAGKALP